MRKYDATIMIRVTKAEKEMLKQRAKKAGFGERNLSKYIREISLTGKIIDYSELQNLTIAVNRIGHNVNQATHIMNTYFDFTGEDFSYIQKEVSKARELIEQYCKKKK